MARIKDSDHKTVVDARNEYKSFVQMALGGSKNFITHPDQEEHPIGNDVDDRRVLSLIPRPYVRIKYESIDSDAGVASDLKAVNYLTKSAFDLFSDLKVDLVGKLDEIRANADDAFKPAQQDQPWGSAISTATLDRIAKLEAEVAQEEEERKAKEEEAARLAAESDDE